MRLLCLTDGFSHMTRTGSMANHRASAPGRAGWRRAGPSCSAGALGTSLPDLRLLEQSMSDSGEVQTAERGGSEVLPPVAAQFSDRPHGSLACPLRAKRAEAGDPISGWPLVESPPTPVAPGGQPVPSPLQRCPAEAFSVPPRRFSCPERRSGDRPGAGCWSSTAHCCGLAECSSRAWWIPAGRWLRMPRGSLPASHPYRPDKGAGHDPALSEREVNHG
jgi:hypothetical protein